ncbi:hypothetical protein B7P34_06795 [Streptosporangium nondiastaticum]|uniref:DNA-binding protein n=1 Tax=Streptosporangium nondiastaticum TaxID=35764 RepID=A0A9X7JTK7_9ACTN|nr:hypothetical protein [Streptosporangium nondiastaticum]PSJ29570.1 hypothetical protein B7P34_06795 [Streptosporangium nondiastaticum]
MSPTTPLICDTVAAAHHFHVTPATVRQWIHRGHVRRSGYDQAGRALVDLREVRDYVTQRGTTAA